MTQVDKQSIMDRLNGAGQVTPTLAEGQNTAPDTVRDIDTITGEILEAKRVGGEAILTIGRGLIEAKSMLSHGEWLPWLNEKVEFSERTARNFMRLARDWTNRQALADLGASKALALLALPESERDEFLASAHQVDGEEKTVIDMTSRELEKAIKERDEARKAAESAQVEAKIAAEARDVIAKDLTLARELLDRTNIDKKAADDAVTALEKQLAELKAAPVDVAVMAVDQEALDRARAEGEAAKAQELADLQAKLDKAKTAKTKAEEERKAALAASDALKAQLEAAEKARQDAESKAQKQAAGADPDVAAFRIYFDQVQETANKLRGLLIKARKREDQVVADKLANALNALGDAMKEAAK